MTQIAHLFENFSIEAESVEPPIEDNLTDAALESFEAGYSLGWEDALTAHSNSKQILSTKLLESIENAEVACEKQYAEALERTEHIIDTVINKLFTVDCLDPLPLQIMSAVKSAAVPSSKCQAVITTGPEMYSVVSDILNDWGREKPEVQQDSNLSLGEVNLRIDREEISLNIDHSVKEIRILFEAFLATVKG